MSLKKFICSQFETPKGFFGKIAYLIMKNRESNIARNIWGLKYLDLCEGDKYLEIGFGPGVTFNHVLETIGKSGKIIGLDKSDLIISLQKKLIKTNQNIDILSGDIENKGIQNNLKDLGPFDKIFSSNVIQFFKEPKLTIEYIFSILNKGGVLVIIYQPRGMHNIDTLIEDSKEILKNAGFNSIDDATLDGYGEKVNLLKAKKH